MTNEQAMPTKLIRRCYYLEQGGYAFGVGLYLFTTGPFLNDALRGDRPDDSVAWSMGFLALMSVLIALFEPFAGAFGDRIRYKGVLCLAIFFRIIFFALAWIGSENRYTPQYLLILAYCALIPFSLGYALRSGSDDAWLYAILKPHFPEEKKLDREAAEIIARGNTWYWLAFVVGSAVGGACLSMDAPQWPYLIGIVSCAALLAVLLIYMQKPEHTPRKRRTWAMLLEALKLVLQNRFLLGLTLVTALIQSLADVSEHAWGIVFKHGRKYPDFGFPAVVFAGAAALGSLFMDGAVKQMRLSMLYLFAFASAAFVVPLMLVDRTSTPTSFMVCIAVSQCLRGAYRGPLRVLQNQAIPTDSDRRATTLSLIGATGNIVVAILCVPMQLSPNSTQGWTVVGFAALLSIATLFFHSQMPK